MSNWHLAKRRKISAFRFGPILWLTAEGDKPSPCYEVEFQYAPEDIVPPEFNLVWRQPLGVFCIQVVTPYRVTARFSAAPFHDTVRVHYDGGTDVVKIQNIPIAAPAPEPKTVTGGGPVEAWKLYTGHSSTSFEEAYFEAVSQIKPTYADELINTQIVAQGGTHGGIAGLNLLFVTIRQVGAGIAAEAEPATAGAAGD